MLVCYIYLMSNIEVCSVVCNSHRDWDR